MKNWWSSCIKSLKIESEFIFHPHGSSSYHSLTIFMSAPIMYVSEAMEKKVVWNLTDDFT